MNSQKYVRKPFDVDAVQVTQENLEAVAKWCQGDIVAADDNGGAVHIKVRVHNPMTDRQTKAYVGDWVLYAGKGFKVYTDKAFRGSFEQPENTPEPQVQNVFDRDPQDAVA